MSFECKRKNELIQNDENAYANTKNVDEKESSILKQNIDYKIKIRIHTKNLIVLLILEFLLIK